MTDVKAGKSAGTRTILLGRMKCELCHLMDEEDARPDAICSDLLEATRKIGIEMQDNLELAMKKELTDILACPVCKGNLELNVEEENERGIISGSLYCSQCNVRCPIVDTIPNLLPPDKHD